MSGSAAPTPALAVFLSAIESFDRRLRAIDDRSLEAFWAWEAYDEEGVRFGILRTTEQVADAAIEIAARRVEVAAAPGRAGRILGRYLVAWRELWSVADRADAARDPALDTAPLEGEWPLRSILDHLIEADLGFLVTIRNGLDQRRSGIGEPERVGSDEAWIALAEVDEPSWRAAIAGSLDDIRAFHRSGRDRIVARLAGMTDDELAVSSPFWDGDRPNRFRLGRFESHLRQHTIQAEKAVQATIGAPREVERLLRLLARATGDVEAAAIGADPGLVEPILGPLVAEIGERTDQLVDATSLAAD
ncbi:MAG TPA: DinB family protein [Candidatus Limnocylindrales bacterium]|nr:DinB family protein [Candidatus Limnocylindrales bacterium]